MLSSLDKQVMVAKLQLSQHDKKRKHRGQVSIPFTAIESKVAMPPRVDVCTVDSRYLKVSHPSANTGGGGTPPVALALAADRAKIKVLVGMTM